MSRDDLDAVLASIDGALDDWTVSGDAMRWAPEPEQARPARGWRLLGAEVHELGCDRVHEYLDRPPSCRCGALDRVAALGMPRQQGRPPLGFLGAALAAAEDHERARRQLALVFGDNSEALAEAWQRLGQLVRETAQSMGEAMRTLTEGLRPIREQLVEAGVLADEGPTDPKARALWMRQHRNTGPQVPRAQAARRPRRHR